jgi:hypothetical protein
MVFHLEKTTGWMTTHHYTLLSFMGNFPEFD